MSEVEETHNRIKIHKTV